MVDAVVVDRRFKEVRIVFEPFGQVQCGHVDSLCRRRYDGVVEDVISLLQTLAQAKDVLETRGGI